MRGRVIFLQVCHYPHILASMRRPPNPFDGHKVARLRDEQGYTTRAFAAKVGISEAYMGRIERGERLGSPAVRRRIVEALGVTLADLAPDVPIAA